MASAQTDERTSQKPLRLWPCVVTLILQWLVRYVLPVVEPETMMFAVLGGLAGGLALVVWWVFLSRAPWSERLGAIALMIVALFATSRIVHESIRNPSRPSRVPTNNASHLTSGAAQLQAGC